MLLTASPTAELFTQHEFRSLELNGDSLVLHSVRAEVRIPFSEWSGKLSVKRGLVWSSVSVFAHEENDKQVCWVVQGVPWREAQDFAKYAVNCYQQWHHKQCGLLNTYLPKWEDELRRLRSLPQFLPQSQMVSWADAVNSEFLEINMSLSEAMRTMPKRINNLIPWLDDTATVLAERNQTWLENERENWQVLFSQSESSPLNYSQQMAVLHNNDQNLILAGAGSGKTSVLMARVSYLLQSHLAQADQILLVAFGRDAASEMKQRLEKKLGQTADAISVLTFHQLGLKILKETENQPPQLTPLATEQTQKTAWCIDWLKKHWMTPTNFKRWQKHLSKWPIAYLKGDEELGSQSENPKLIAWLEQQLDQLISAGLSKKAIQEKIIDEEEYARFNSELALCWPCYQAWQKMLKENEQIDFTSMITKATKHVSASRFKSNWKFVMVDEYQDISPDRLELVQALCEQKLQDDTNATLYAVGDDWQSIYQFTGSDVDLTTGFEQRFPNASIHLLDTTYRFNDKLLEVASDFIQANPTQLTKDIKSHKSAKQKAVIVEQGSRVEKILEELNSKSKQGKSVLLLGRNHYHKPELFGDWCKQFANLSLEFMTCHSSKGKEADYVIVVGADEGQFPAKRKFVHLNNALTIGTDTYEHAEERRLFYVALTRAKTKVWVTYQSSPSIFVRELMEHEQVLVKK
ncbi:DNA helicase IV [Vibrio mediterranei]|uniref:DNA 3'-5' helicase n=1 Tax=Vibrio mediterranei TaxID=689 RepID=A0ABX5DHK1_9VIBR|nr:DNA helicase IV [Vibrio mediterranei]PCD88040.1 DNA helicase IV [Vibrio mediterranei]PRQ67761.1 DNA helicase IV [Vibrio mediterranei]